MPLDGRTRGQLLDDATILGLAADRMISEVDVRRSERGFMSLVPFDLDEEAAIDFALESLGGQDPTDDGFAGFPALDDFDLNGDEIVTGFGLQAEFVDDFELDVDRDGGVFALPWRARGLHVAHAGDIPASGRLIDFIGTTIATIDGNEAVMRTTVDRISLFTQMGVPISARPAEPRGVRIAEIVEHLVNR